MHERTSAFHALQPLDRESRPSVLITGGDATLRLFLRGSLRQWYQVAEAPTGDQVMSHLAHCPPQGLIAGPLRGGEEVVSALRTPEAPPVLKLWTVDPPAGWDKTLRYPFTRGDLLRAVGRMLGEEKNRATGDAPEAEKIEPRVNVSR